MKLHFFDWIGKILHHTKSMTEEEMIEEIDEENKKSIEQASQGIPATVIYYSIDEASELETPIINVLVEEFHCNLLPEAGSIIWITINEQLRSFKVIRYDYIENGSDYDVLRVYIVVEPATNSDVVPNPKFNV